MKKASLLVIALLTLALALPAAAAQGKSKKKKSKSGATQSSVSVDFSFGKTGTKSVRDWFGNTQNTAGLPPGLAKREELPPGLKRHLEKNGTLPPGLQKKIQPLPHSLTSQLPKPPDGIDIVFVAGNVLAIEVSTNKIIDIVADIKIAF
jgi:hypothetical protein